MTIKKMSDARRPSLARRVLRFPLTRLVLALAFVFLGGVVASFLRNGLALAFGVERGSNGHGVLSMFTIVPIVTLAYWAYVRVVERRPLDELSRDGALRELGIGVLLGAGLFTAVVAAIAVLGGYHVGGLNPPIAMLQIFTASVLAGSVEEIVARGVIFRIIEDGLGTWAALVISAVVFGVLHHANPNATWISSASIAITAGLLLGAAYVLTRRLWLVMGLHFAWNFTQGGIFGVAVSGHDAGGLLQSSLSGSEWISGGAFGPEASIFAVLFCVPVAAIVLVRGHREGRFLPPMWKRDSDA